MAESVPSTSEIRAPEHPEATEWLWDDEDALESEAAPDQPRDRRSPLLFFCSMAVLGVFLALVWRYAGAAQLADQLWAGFKSSQASAALTAPVPSVPPPPQTAELDALKAEVGKLTAANRQMSAEIATLQDQQRELARRAAAPTSTTNLFSNPSMLKLQIAPRTLTTGTVSRGPATIPAGRTDARSRAAPKATNAPLALAPPNERPWPLTNLPVTVSEPDPATPGGRWREHRRAQKEIDEAKSKQVKAISRWLQR